MTDLPKAEWRFDHVCRVNRYAACVWEYCREFAGNFAPALVEKLKRSVDVTNLRESELTLIPDSSPGKSVRLATLGAALRIPQFPAAPWLMLPKSLRAALRVRWTPQRGALEDYAVLPSAIALGSYEAANRPGAAPLESSVWWRETLHKSGCVVFDLGTPPRDAKLPAYVRAWNTRQPTRAMLEARFRAWLDENPQWWRDREDDAAEAIYRTFGRRNPNDGLRTLGWTRLRRSCGSDAETEQVIKAHPHARAWFQDDISAERARKLPAAAVEWQELICLA